MQCDSGCYLVYPYPAQHFVNGLACAAQSLKLSPQSRTIPITISSKTGEYRSPFALSLETSNAEAIALDMQDIVQNYLQEQFSPAISLGTASGWIDLRLSAKAQRDCLLHLSHGSQNNNPEHLPNGDTLDRGAFQMLSDTKLILPDPIQLKPDLVFALQHAHARCCSVLRLADRNFRDLPPLSLKWLENYVQLYSTSPERDLLRQLINFPQMLQPGNQLMPTMQTCPEAFTDPALVLVKLPSRIDSKRLQALVQDWAQLFQNFYASAQICHLTLPESESLLALRLTLFQALRNLIEFILTKLCQQCAPKIL